MTFRQIAFAAVLLFGLLLGSAAANAASSFAIVIGIDDYQATELDLAGAVADAKDIASALQGAGASVVLLTNLEATAQALDAAWAEQLEKARYGDMLIVTFAGLGRHRDGGYRYLLAGYSPDLPEESVSQATLFDWAGAAEEKGVRFLFVGDAGFAGDLERAFPKDFVALRQWPTDRRESGKTPSSNEASSSKPENQFGKATFVYGAPRNRAVPELTLAGAPRGGLSWAFARALEGAAAEDADGMLSDHELATYLPLAVGALSEGQQAVEVLPTRSSPIALMPVVGSGATPEGEAKKLRLAVEGGEIAVTGPIPDVEIVNDPRKAELIWSVEQGTLTHRIGGWVAQGITAQTLGPVLAKWLALDWLKGRAALSPAPIDLVSGPARQAEGARVQIEILPGRYPMLTVFDLTPDGDVIPILPAKPEDAQKPQNRRHIHQMFQVGGPPYGALHRVAIFSEKPLTGLQERLAKMDKAESANGLRQALNEALPADAKAQIGIFPIYLGPGD